MSQKKSMSRRDFLKLGGAAAATAVATMAPKQVFADSKTRKKARIGFLIDLRRCTGCHACSVACKAEFAVPLGVYKSWVEVSEQGSYPETKRKFEPKLCNHCDDAPCVPVCPVKATYIREDGIVDIDPDKCIGCHTCITACPYKARYFDPDTRSASKCNFCLHRIQNGVVPACVNTCPANTRVIGNLADPLSKISRLIKRYKNRLYVLKPELGTEPQVFYIKREG